MADDGDTVAALVAAATEGVEAAWNDLVVRYAPLLRSVLSRHGLFGADAEDVCQIVWLRLVENLGKLREPRALPTWLVTTTRNECIGLLRARRWARPFDPLADGAVEIVDHRGLDEGMLHAELREALLEAFAELSDQHRTLLSMLVADPPVPYSEISERLGMPVGSIGPTRARALRKLRFSAAVVAFFEVEPQPQLADH